MLLSDYFDYSRCATVRYPNHDPKHYIIHHYGRPPNGKTVMIGHWWRFPIDVYSGAAMDALGLDTMPIKTSGQIKLL